LCESRLTRSLLIQTRQCEDRPVCEMKIIIIIIIRLVLWKWQWRKWPIVVWIDYWMKADWNMKTIEDWRKLKWNNSNEEIVMINVCIIK